MNKSDLIGAMAAKTGLSKADAKKRLFVFYPFFPSCVNLFGKILDFSPPAGYNNEACRPAGKAAWALPRPTRQTQGSGQNEPGSKSRSLSGSP